MYKKLMMTLVMLVLMTACGSSSTQHNLDSSKINDQMMEGNTQFAWDIFNELKDENESVFISPFSISTALTMTYQGASGETKDDMAEVLGYSEIEMEQLNESYQEYINYLNQLSDVDLSVANSIWFREGLQVKDEFIETNEKTFDSGIFERDFTSDQTVDEINHWVSDETEGLIDEIITSSIPGNIQMYLINAIYFKGEWQEKFNKDRTSNEKFHVNKDQSVTVSMMKKEETLQYGEGENYQMIEMEYGEGSTSMYVMLPKDNKSLDAMIQDLDASRWNGMIENMNTEEDVIIEMPSFKVKYGVKSIKDNLISLGMERPFQAADFSGMSESGLRIDDVLHKAVIEVNEEGSEAAAVTAVAMVESGSPERKVFQANRPFLYVIADEETDSILFMGTYYGE
ncbi:serpin family protein [Tenuibacillus multivorans]|uniref:Serpin B n=1 Tax=Tenuibacillus multivorans TaxID=237069 RepID=A0A1H0DSF0_9BACI|nr:serpin family protein [Tenuibacillus multivorans]GEL78827.1 serpin [Tenuibacillus multivorans]SDN73008.1 serpin B [Tenuibacillus multivorans]